MYYLLEYIELETRELFFRNSRVVRTISCKKYSKELEYLIKYMIENDMTEGFFILDEDEFMKQHPKLQCGLLAKNHIFLYKKGQKFHIGDKDFCYNLDHINKCVEKYNSYIDMKTEELYGLYREKGGGKIYPYFNREDLAKYLLKYIYI